MWSLEATGQMHLYVRIYLRVSLWGFPGGSAGKESACTAGDPGSIPGLGRSPGEGKGCPLQYSCLENSRDCTVHGVAKGRTGLSNFHFHFSSRKWRAFTLRAALLNAISTLLIFSCLRSKL